MNNKKIPCIPPIFYENDFAIDFQKKAEIFNEFFAKQCIVVPNSSKLSSAFIRKTDKYLSTATFYENEIKKAIRNLDPNKAHGHDILSIRMLKICDESLCLSVSLSFSLSLCGLLGLIYQSCFENGKYPAEWKKRKCCSYF